MSDARLPWAYRCSVCGEIVEVDDMTRHAERHRREPDWPGHMSWTRIDKEETDGHDE